MSVRGLVVGGGVTGSYFSLLLGRLCQSKLSVEIVDAFPLLSTAVDKSGQGLGGRMKTVMMNDDIVDLGAQYITRYLGDEFSDVFTDLEDRKLLRPFEDVVEGARADHRTQTHYVSPTGLDSIVRDFAVSSSAEITTGCRVVSINRSQLNAWDVSLRSERGDVVKTYDHVFFCLPPPALREIDGDWRYVVTSSSEGDLFASVEQVQYSSRFAAAVFLPAIARAALDELPWTSKYVSDDDVIRYLSLEFKKSRSAGSTSAAILVHTSVPFGLKYSRSPAEGVREAILASLYRQLPSLTGIHPLHTELVRWEHSQASNPLKSSGGEGSGLAVRTEGGALLSLASDAFTESNFEGCLRSARYTAQTVAALLQQHK